MTPPVPGTLGDVLGALRGDISAGIAGLQSPYLYIQAAGSDGSDGSVPGIHARWTLLGNLGDTHLPKGNLAVGSGAPFAASHGFNKADDFVAVLRIQYKRPYPCSVNFSTDTPVALVESGLERSWKFNALVDGVSPVRHREVIVRFSDVVQYNSVRSTTNPLTAAPQFLASYTGVLEVEVTGELCFALSLAASTRKGEKSPESHFRIEAISVAENMAGAELSIACRKRFSFAGSSGAGNAAARVCAENVKYFRFDYAGQAPQLLQLETYKDLLDGSMADRESWEVIGTQFALSDDDATVFERLENTSLEAVDRKWPRYYGADQAAGLFTTSVANYKAKWDPTLPPTNEPTAELGLRQGVIDYLTLSMNAANPQAMAALAAQDPGDSAAFEISYLLMLRLISLDFHAACMLGLGCRDTRIPPEGPAKYVYVAVYRTVAPLETTASPTILLPTSLSLAAGQSLQFPVSISQPAPAEGLFVSLSISDISKVGLTPTRFPALIGQNPTSVFIPPGKTTSIQTVWVHPGLVSETIHATAQGFAPASTQVHLGNAAVFGSTATQGPPEPRTHIYMTLPTSRQDSRLPLPPVQEDPTFGLFFDNGTSSPVPLTDIDGYTPFDNMRIINLHLQPYDTVQEFGPFFDPPVEFCSSEVTKPVFYGCKYKRTGDSAYQAPELSNDPEYNDPSGKPEVAPLLPQSSDGPGGNQPIFTHREQEDGKHDYAFYGVSWFSRTSTLSNVKTVDTLIPRHHSLLPPANLAVQLIQPEEPLMLTTPAEQTRRGLLAGDKTLVRCTFDWNMHNYIPQELSAANLYADKVQFFFRQDPPRAIQGEIKSVTKLLSGLIEVQTQPYSNISGSQVQVVNPTLLLGDEPRFVGSAFASNQVIYTVDSADPSTVSDGAVFRIRENVQSTVTDFDHNNQFESVMQVTIPSVGDRFLVVENMNNVGNWDTSHWLAKVVALVNFLNQGQLYTETVTHPDGTQRTLTIGGIVESATIVEVPDVDCTSGSPVPIQQSKTGIYTITFDTFQLTPHSDPDVEWYKGTVRVPEAAAGNMRPLQVYATGKTLSGELTLTAFDPTFNVDNSYVPQGGYIPIQIPAGSIAVNFHPGYRVYLEAQAGLMDESTTLPTPLQSTKQTILAARACNTVLAATPIDSDLTTPVVLQARAITVLAALDEPQGPLYATRPDLVFGRSTWTMDLKSSATATHEPYAFIFLRANEQTVLDTLYKPTTVADILSDLQGLSSVDAAGHWRDLVNLTHLESDFGFKQSAGFRFPLPDNDKYVIPETVPVPGLVPVPTPVYPFNGSNKPGDPGKSFPVEGQQVTMLEVVTSAIRGAFLPLTESPVIYQFIYSGTQTSSRKPVVRNSNGDLLPFTPQSGYDPSPMAVKYVDGSDTIIRFTDYTLDGAAANTYFYYAVELSDQMRFGPPSPIVGPVKLVNAYPAETPAIRRVTAVIEDQVLGITTGVRLAVNAYIESEGITDFNLYRATNPADATSTRTMTLVGSYAANPGAETELFDDFSDLDFPPFGDPIFYRVVALRTIENEYGFPELIPSKPSDLARASVIDVNNPVAPAITFSSDPPTTVVPVTLPNVILSWPTVTHNGSYRLFKQHSSGNWNKIYEEIKTNISPISVALSATTLGTPDLIKQDADGTPIYHRFKVEVENASGMFSLNEVVLTVPATCREGYGFLNQVVTYADDYPGAGPLADQLRDPAVTTFPGSMTFQDIISTLPTGHAYDRTEITVLDGQGHSAKHTINTAGGSVTFQHNDSGSGLVLDGSIDNVSYTVRARVFTDSCQEGILFSYRLRFGPELELMDLTDILSYADSLNTVPVLDDAFDSSGLQFPTKMTFADITSLPANHTFVKTEIQVLDDMGGSASKTISVAGGSASFTDGEGGLILGSSAPNRTYQVTARLFTDLSSNGIPFVYIISYA